MRFPKWLLLMVVGGAIALGVAYDDKTAPKRVATSAEPRERRHKHRPAPTARPPSTAPDTEPRNAAVAAVRPVAAAEPEPSKPTGPLRTTAMALWVLGGVLFCGLILLPWGRLRGHGFAEMLPHPLEWWTHDRKWRFRLPWERRH